jgi:hypothetical protein
MLARTWLSAIAVAALAACASNEPPVGRTDLLDVVKPGAARADIVLRLGPPSATFEGERIMAWSIGADAGGYTVSGSRHGSGGAPGQFSRYELVIVFDAGGRVEKHNLVEVRKPQ